MVTRTDLLSFMIADIRGYSTFTRERGDTAAALLAQRFADLSRDAVEARSGRVIELRGDEAFAVFDSAAQAVRAAIDVQATFAEESRSDPAFQLPVGIGIDVGEAVPVEGGYRGVAVNMAARLCSSAAAGQVLVTRPVVDRVGTLDDVTFADRGLATFKGFEEPVEVIEALGVVHARAAAQPPDRTGPVSDRALPPELDPITPLVDREREMRWMRGTWRQVRRGHGRILLVSGPAQIGKTRLAAEVASFVHAEGADVRYSGQGGTGAALAMSAIRGVTLARDPLLLVLDDLDVAGPAPSQALMELCDEIAGHSVLVLGLLRDRAASTELASLVDRADDRGDGHRTLGPFGLDDVRGIVRLYLGEAEQEAPVESFARASEGVPGRVHELVSDWTRSEASRRLSAAAEFLATGRERHASDLEFANNAIAMKLGRFFAVGGRDILAIETCPYKGLAQFDAVDSPLFFGRERLVGELAARTVGTGLLGVVGASGSGKSSAIAAGLLPSLEAGLLPGSERWRHVTMRPGAHPMEELRRVLGSDTEQPLEASLATMPGDARLVLVVDQFEEVFTLCGDEGGRAAFIDALTGPALRSPDRVVVVPSVRGDHFAHAATYPEFAESLAANTVLVGPLSRDELRRAIELPARRAGLRIESALVDALVEEVADEPGSLPLLSTALVELWQSRDAGWIRMRAYEHTGGVEGAVARLADASYSQLSESEQEAARRVLLRLVVTDEREGISKRRVSMEEFDLDKDVASAGVIARLTQDRLLTVGEDTVEVSHEALLREWPRLRGWLDDDVQGRQLHAHLMEATREWSAGGEDPADLYRGARLASAMDWTADHTIDLNDRERAFLERSREANEAEVQRTRRTNRRLRASLVGVAMFLVVALVGGSIAVEQRGRARDSARVADARRLSAQALAETHLDQAALLALAGVRLDATLETRSALLQVLQHSPAALAVAHGPGSLDGLALSADGDTLAMAAPFPPKLELFDIPSRTPIGDVVTLDGGVNNTTGRTIAFVPHHPLVVAGVDGSNQKQNWLDFVDTRDPNVEKRIHLGKYWFPESVAASPDGRWVVVGNVHVAAGATDRPVLGHEAVVFDSTTGSRVKTLQLGSHDLYAFGTNVVFSPDGRRLVTSIVGKTVVWSTRSWQPRRDFTASGRLAMSPDGRTIAIGENDGTIQLVDVHSGPTLDMRGSLEPVTDVAFTENGRTLFSAGRDQAVRVWDVGSAALVRTLSGHAGVVCCVVPSPDGRTAYSASEDGTVITWDVEGHRALDHPLDLTQGAAHPDIPFIDAAGNTLAVSMNDRNVGLWNTDDWQWEGQVTVRDCRDPKTGSPCPMYALARSPDGRYLLIGTGGNVTEWDLATRSRVLPQLRASAKDVWGADFSPDGSSFVTFGESITGSSKAKSELQVRDARSGRLIWHAAIAGDASGPATHPVEFSPDGSLLAVATCCFEGPDRVEVLDATDGRQLVVLHPPGTPTTLAFSPHGTLLVGTTEGISFWDPRTGRPVPSKITSGTNFVSLSYSTDGRWLAGTNANDGTVLLWDVASGTQLGAPFPSTGFQTIFFFGR